MKKAVILTGSKQYLVSEGDLLDVELLHSDKKNVTFDALLLIDGEKTTIGAPTISGVTITAEIIDTDHKADKVTAIRYKAKKRVHKIHGHRQHLTKLKISSIK